MNHRRFQVPYGVQYIAYFKAKYDCNIERVSSLIDYMSGMYYSEFFAQDKNCWTIQKE